MAEYWTKVGIFDCDDEIPLWRHVDAQMDARYTDSKKRLAAYDIIRQRYLKLIGSRPSSLERWLLGYK